MRALSSRDIEHKISRLIRNVSRPVVAVWCMVVATVGSTAVRPMGST